MQFRFEGNHVFYGVRVEFFLVVAISRKKVDLFGLSAGGPTFKQGPAIKLF